MNDIIESPQGGQSAQAQKRPQPALLPVVSATPLDLMRIAIERGTDMAQLEKLMALQERWEAGEARKAFNVSFAKFKSEAVLIVKNKQVTDGPLKGKAYAELFSVVNAVTPALSAHGLSVSWKLTKDEEKWIEVTCSIRHSSGHSESVSMGGPPDSGGAKSPIQGRASTVTYLERYTLKAITGLAEQDDDTDGASETARMYWLAAVAGCTTIADLTELASAKGPAVVAFQKMRDTEGYSQFVKAVKARGAELKPASTGEPSEG